MLNAKNNEVIEQSKNQSLEKFDIRSTVNHLYLKSNDLGEVPATYSILDADSTISVPILVMEAVLLPGQILPLHFTEQSCINFLKLTTKKHPFFCLINCFYDNKNNYVDPFYAKIYSKIGTLFIIKNVGIEHNRLTIYAIGRQKCCLTENLSFSNLLYDDFCVSLFSQGKILILSELMLPSLCYLPDSKLCRLPKKKRKILYSYLTTHNAFTISQSSTDQIVLWLKSWLQKWFDLNRINIILNQGYVVFSYWVASNLPIDLKTKLLLLEEMCVDRRLRIEWSITSQINFLICSTCGEVKCNINDLINLSIEGNGMHFVNSNGYVHEMFTVSQIKNIILSGKPSTEFSWFPGYAWTILHCAQCKRHIGWKFTSSKFFPKKFYGITRRTLKLKKIDR